MKNLASNVLSSGGKKYYGFGHILGCTGPGKGYAGEIFSFFGLGEAGGPFDDPGGDSIDADMGGELAGEAAGEVQEAGFAGAIFKVSGEGNLGLEVDHIDDGTPSGFEHGGETAGEEARGFDVD